jgi:Spy/CpxP family protein refolding chaperone/alpha-acetolactate decarboxylase
MLRAAAIVVFLSSPVAALAQGLIAHGSFRHMMHSGDASGAVALDSFDTPFAWGVGATAGMRGEVVIMEGRVRISRGDDPEARLTPPVPGEQAAILVYGAVEAWREVALPHEMTPEQLTKFLEHRGPDLGLDLAAGFPLRVHGVFPTLQWHVVTGGHAVPRAGHGGAHGGGHANTRAGMRVFDEPGAAGELVGVYTGAALVGVASHPGERLHLHVVTADGARSGHVDSVVVPAGATLLLPVAATCEAAAHSPYAGLESRAIKSLSDANIDELRRGGGWGLALAAELNGKPGPAHLLELYEELGLSPAQVAAIETIFAAMQAEARAAGERFIAAEAAIEDAFRKDALDPDRLRALIDAAEEARAELRFIHLARHLKTPPLLTAEQIAHYAALRGYGAADPCAAVPQGHDPAMWRRHNACE